MRIPDLPVVPYALNVATMWEQLYFSLSTEAAVRGCYVYLRSPMHGTNVRTAVL